VLHGFLVDVSEEHGGLLVCGRSPKQSEWADVRFPPKPPGRYSWRTDVTALQFFVEPCGGAGCKMTLQLGVDDPGDACPNWLVDALMKRVIARLFSARGDEGRPRSPTAHDASVTRPRRPAGAGRQGGGRGVQPCDEPSRGVHGGEPANLQRVAANQDRLLRGDPPCQRAARRCRAGRAGAPMDHLPPPVLRQPGRRQGVA